MFLFFLFSSVFPKFLLPLFSHTWSFRSSSYFHSSFCRGESIFFTFWTQKQVALTFSDSIIISLFWTLVFWRSPFTPHFLSLLLLYSLCCQLILYYLTLYNRSLSSICFCFSLFFFPFSVTTLPLLFWMNEWMNL